MTNPDIRTVFPRLNKNDIRGIQSELVQHWLRYREPLNQNLDVISAAVSRQELSTDRLDQLHNFLTVTRAVINQYPDQLPQNLRVILPHPDSYIDLKARLSLHLPNKQHGSAAVFWDEFIDNRPPRLALTLYRSNNGIQRHTYRYNFARTAEKGWVMGIVVARDEIDPVTRRITYRKPMSGEPKLIFDRLNQYAQVVAPPRTR